MKNTIYIILFGFLLLIAACKDDDCYDPSNPACCDYDPCYGVEETSADFYIYQNLGAAAPLGWEDKDVDTIVFRGPGATFTAKQEADVYTWYIGSEVINDRTFSRGQLPEAENIEVTLIVENFDPDTLCFPNDDGKDTLIRTFYTSDSTVRPKWEGTFEGAYDFAPDEVHQFSLHEDSFRVNQLPYPECRSELDLISLTYNSVHFVVRKLYQEEQPTERCEEGYMAYMHINKDNSFTIKIIGSNSNPNLEGHTMTGVKIN